MTISVNFIQGVMLGFELIDAELVEESRGFLAVDILILRFLVEW
jgi:hypothetical protein